MEKIVTAAKNFLKFKIGNELINNPTIYPWRKYQMSIYLHSLRVHHIALKLLKEEKVSISDQVIIETAAILHDIGKLENCEDGHALRSGEIVLEWLDNNKDIKAKIDYQRLIDIIKNHSSKDINDNNICSQILKDADIIDELGALSILMQAYKVNHDDYSYYNKVLENLKNKELAFCNKVKCLIQTKSGLRFVETKIKFIKDFINELESELIIL